MQHLPPHAPMQQGPDMRNLLIAFLLTMAILFVWQTFFTPRVAKPVASSPSTATATTASTAAVAPVAEAEAAPVPREEALARGTRIAIASKRLHGSIAVTGKGLRLDDLTLADYRQKLDPESPEVVLLSPSASDVPYFIEYGWLTGAGVTLPNAESTWETDGDSLTPETPVTLRWKSPEGVVFSITLALDEHYLFTVTRRVENPSASAISMTPYGLINRSYDLQQTATYISHEGALGVFAGTLEEVTFHNMAEEAATNTWQSQGGWAGMGDKYWLTALLPAQDVALATSAKFYQKGQQARFQMDMLEPAITINAGATHEQVTHLYAGAKELALLDRYGAELGLPLFDRAVDFGVLYFLTKPFFQFLQYIYSVVGNFGIAIMILTVVIRLALFPLANKSYQSMAQLRALQPKMEQLREKYGTDKVQMNQELIALYQREKVNPMSGCLPILLQIPIFFALYKVLYVSIEMRHAPFYGWVHDLSAPDPTSFLNLFGLLPWETPAMLTIGIWPLLMMVTMVIQQRLHPAPTDPVQATMMKWMPYVFLFFFAHFPAGLVIYWTWSNTLSILQQWVIIQKHGHMAPVPHKGKSDTPTKKPRKKTP